MMPTCFVAKFFAHSFLAALLLGTLPLSNNRELFGISNMHLQQAFVSFGLRSSIDACCELELCCCTTCLDPNQNEFQTLTVPRSDFSRKMYP